jgi:diacylglycerol kinase family enzyme
MASRVADLGGLFSGLARTAKLTDFQLQIQVLRPPAQLAFPAWMLCGRMGIPNPWLTTVAVNELRCSAIEERPVYAQADAEPLATLPIAMRLAPAALSLLMPGDAD